MRNLPRADLAVAGVLAAYALVEGLLLSAPAEWLLASMAACAALAWRRRHPAAVVAFVLVVVFLPGAIGAESVDSVLPLPLMIVCGYTAGHEAVSGRQRCWPRSRSSRSRASARRSTRARTRPPRTSSRCSC